MALPFPPFDVLVIGNHPAGLLAASILAQDPKLRVAHTTLPNPTPPPPITLLNPELFSLHPLLNPLKRKIPALPIHGIRFLNSQHISETRSRAALSSIAAYKDVAAAFQSLAAKTPIRFFKPKTLQILSVADQAHLLLDNKPLVAKTLLISTPVNPIPWNPNVLRTRASLSLKTSTTSRAQLLSLSLNLQAHNHFGWLLPGKKQTLLVVEKPFSAPTLLPQLMTAWINLLLHHKILAHAPTWSPEQLQTLTYPAAGALSHETITNRTLLIGPAGGFYSAIGEDLFPNCWSALFAAETLKTALHSHLLQDTLQSFRANWGATLGHHLRAPHENLNYLLPLIFHNPILAHRTAATLLQGPK